MLSRFYSREGDGKLLWRENTTYDATQWERIGWTTWNLIPYGVYERTLPEPAAEEVLEAPEKTGGPTRRRGRRRRPPATGQPAAELVEQEVPDEADETPAELAGQEAPPQELEDDGGGWSDVKSSGAVRAEREMARDVGGLARDIDAHEGDPQAIRETFSQFFNARLRQGLALEGVIVSAYTTRAERLAADGSYSIEVTIPGLAGWVIHAHLVAGGGLAEGANPIHYKRRADVGLLGVSIGLTPRQIAALLPDEATRAASARAARRTARNV
jgi:hypothetical protein